MKYLRQIIFEMKHQKVMTWVSISGIALSIFLVMVFFMMERLPMVEAAPETNRSRMLYGGGIDIHGENWSQSGAMSYKMTKKIYDNLEGIEKMARSSNWSTSANVGIKGKLSYSMSEIMTDADFWAMYDFRFISGKPYTRESMESGEKVVVITKSVAHQLFSKEDVSGESVNINSVPYRISGVVEDVNPIMNATFSNIYMPFTLDVLSKEDYTGGVMVHLLMKPGVKEEDIKAQIKARCKQMNAVIAKDKEEIIYHEAPHNSEYLADGWIFSNLTPDLSEKHRDAWITYIILLLLPAINLSCMMRGRLRHRVSEIGVRRAYGAKRSSIIIQILGENLIVTLIGGLIGFVCSYVFIYVAADYFFTISEVDSTALQYASSTPALSMLFTWTNFFVALGVCFVLNLLSAFLPACKASNVEPAVAITKAKV